MLPHVPVGHARCIPWTGRPPKPPKPTPNPTPSPAPTPQALAELQETNPSLPEQIVVELHFTTGAKHNWNMRGEAARNQFQMSMLFMHMFNLGYGIVAKEENRNAVGCCAEYTFLRVEQTVLAKQPGV
jgi:hypothetical protein